jgi:hypothetical protein
MPSAPARFDFPVASPRAADFRSIHGITPIPHVRATKPNGYGQLLGAGEPAGDEAFQRIEDRQRLAAAAAGTVTVTVSGSVHTGFPLDRSRRCIVIVNWEWSISTSR